MIDYQNFKRMSWNATDIMSCSSYSCDTQCKFDIDFGGLSKHWLFENCLNFIEHIDSNYKSVSVADKDCKLTKRRNLGKGGVGILWH